MFPRPSPFYFNPKTSTTLRPTTANPSTDLPLEHWLHDLETLDILLDQHPPDRERAKELIDELRGEMQEQIKLSSG